MQSAVTPLRSHALNALRRAQHRLLEQVLSKLTDAKPSADHINAGIADVLKQAGIAPKSTAAHELPSLETALLEVWSLSEAASIGAVAA